MEELTIIDESGSQFCHLNYKIHLTTEMSSAESLKG